jgi:hypothetical protein
MGIATTWDAQMTVTVQPLILICNTNQDVRIIEITRASPRRSQIKQDIANFSNGTQTIRIKVLSD